MTTHNRPATFGAGRIPGKLVLIAAGAILASPLRAGEVQRITLEVEDALGVPAIQAVISACLGELVFFTGTVQIITVDGVPTHFNWQGMTAVTADGDRFIGGSATASHASTLTLAEVGAGPDSRLVHLQIVDGELEVTCK